MKKTTFTLVMLWCFMSINGCQHPIKKPFIAYNKDRSITLTQAQFSQWLTHYPKLKYQQRTQQIEAYFLHHALLNQRDILSDKTIKKLNFLHQVKHHIAANEQLEKRIFNQSTPSITDIEATHQFLIEHQQLKQPKTRLYQIFKRYVPGASEKDKNLTKKQMQQIKSQVTDLSSFKQLATQHSDGQSRLQKGLIGNVTHDQFNSALDGIITRLKKDQMSDVINLNSGVVLFYCEKKIPVRIKTNDELYKKAVDYHKNKKALADWNQHLSSINAQLLIRYDWKAINGNDPQALIAQTHQHRLTKQQLLWLLNNTKQAMDLMDTSQQKITDTIQQYFQNQYIFEQAQAQTRTQIREELKPQYQTSITSQVLITLIEPQLMTPTQQQIETYYQSHKEKYYLPKSYDLSIIALPLSERDKTTNYNHAQEVYHRIRTGKLDFDQAIAHYSVANGQFPSGRIIQLYDHKKLNVLGKKVTKQLLQMNVGEVSNIVESEAGQLWIIRLDKVTQRNKANLSQSRKKIVDALHNQQIESLETQLTNDLLSALQITYIKNQSN